MGKKRVAASHLHGKNYETLKRLEVIEDLVEPATSPFPLAPNSEENSKLSPLEVYLRLINGTFYIAPPEKSKTSRTTVAKC